MIRRSTTPRSITRRSWKKTTACGIVLLAIFAAFGKPLLAQPSLYEFRGVWLTTVGNFDWPSSSAATAEAQAEELRQIIKRASQQGLNAIVFQVVSRGDALYRSDRLPWSSGPTGVLGMDPGFDPLQVAIDVAHSHGMELHAWVNTYRIRALSTNGGDPPHIFETHPEWTERDGNWLNPGIPGVNEWVLGNVIEIVERYDVDAVHFDFVRYAQSGYVRDDSLFALHNSGGFSNKDDWRRDNVNRFVASAFEEVKERKPWVKVGSTPIGNYDGACLDVAFKGYSEAFQDSRKWLIEGTNDYIVPQVYWPTFQADPSTPSPAYQCLVGEWTLKSGSVRDVYIGIGAYRESVRSELPLELQIQRGSSARGHVWFRDEHIRGDVLDGLYPTEALTPPAAWRFEARVPDRPVGVTADYDALADVVRLNVPAGFGSGTDPIARYAVFRAEGREPDPESAQDLAFVGSAIGSMLVDSLDQIPTMPISYRVAAVSRLGMISKASEAVTIQIPVASVTDEVPRHMRLVGVYPNPVQTRYTVEVMLDRPGTIDLRLYDALGRRVMRRTESRPSGRSRIEMDRRGLASGMYELDVVVDDQREVRVLVIS